LIVLDSGARHAQDVAMDAANPDAAESAATCHARPARPWTWLWALGLLAAGVVLGLAFAAYGGADLLLNFTNLRYCG
jgi:predicted lipid-binding transport protein (Tim44 family)